MVRRPSESAPHPFLTLKIIERKNNMTIHNLIHAFVRARRNQAAIPAGVPAGDNKLMSEEVLLASLLEEGGEPGTISVEEWLAIKSGGISKALELSPEAERWHEIRKEEAFKIDPDTAEVCSDYGEYSDPYKIYPEIPEFAADPIEQMYFVRRPDGDIWVWDNDLPDAVFAALWERLKAIQDDIPCFMSVRASTNPIRFFRRCSTTLQIPLLCERPLMNAGRRSSNERRC
jgi:hypothetical protein